MNSSLLSSVVQAVVPEPCFTKIFTDFDILNIECAKIVISKCLGYGIILGSILVKLPQILKILNAKSGEGISLLSVFLELVAVSSNAAYAYAKGFPFSSYGEGAFLTIQTSIVMFLVIFFGGNLIGAFLFLLTYGVAMGYLLSPLVSIGLLTTLQGTNIAIVILSKLLQVHANYSNGSTGQLSVITQGLLLAGSLVRVFTSVQETGDQLTVITYVVATACNALIVAQIWYYWNKKPKEE